MPPWLTGPCPSWPEGTLSGTTTNRSHQVPPHVLLYPHGTVAGISRDRGRHGPSVTCPRDPPVALYLQPREVHPKNEKSFTVCSATSSVGQSAWEYHLPRKWFKECWPTHRHADTYLTWGPFLDFRKKRSGLPVRTLGQTAHNLNSKPRETLGAGGGFWVQAKGSTVRPFSLITSTLV